jgi:glycosyltransferase involved in cell wall biosynthesis
MRDQFNVDTLNYAELKAYSIDVHINPSQDELIKLIREAGIFFHVRATNSKRNISYFPPVSICEALATGAYVIGRNNAEFKQLIDIGGCFTNEDEAIELINATSNWSNDEWQVKNEHAINRAFEQFLDDRILAAMLNNWLAIKQSSQQQYFEAKK